MNDVIRDVSVLWEKIAGTAKFDHKEYDQELLRRIGARLGISGQKITGTLLRKNGISCEELLQAVLGEMLPFSQMLSDLLAMFRQAGAQQSDENLKIQFDFNRGRELFKTDLDFFRQQTSAANRVISSAVAMIPVQPFELLGKFGHNDSGMCKRMLPKDVQEWLEVYWHLPRGTWPDHLPDRPVSGFPELDGQLGRLWDVLNASLWKYRNEFRQEKWMNTEGAEWQFWYAETDQWLGICIRKAYKKVAELEQKAPDERAQTADVWAHELREALEQCRMLPVELQQQYQAVLDILNLPFWKQRYELYSAWVSTQILAAFRDQSVTFQVKDHTLSFSFGGSHIATIDTMPPLELWAEVRTYYDTPKGRSRKHNIQPDYTLAIGDAYQADNSVAVVECKQYKKYSRSNFLNAAEDYAGGRPNSSVFLVNYGAVPQTLQAQTDPCCRDRIQFHGQIVPTSAESTKFRKALRSAVDAYYRKHHPVRVPEYALPGKDYKVRLRWGYHPMDLDLHMLASDQEQDDHVYYGNQYAQRDDSSAKLDRDEKYGGGRETITLTGWTEGRCDFYVHDYQETGSIDSPISITIDVDDGTLYAISRVEPIPVGCCWHPFTISGRKIRIVDEIVGNSVIQINRKED